MIWLICDSLPFYRLMFIPVVLAISAGPRKFFFKSAVRQFATEFQFSKSDTSSPQLHV